MNKYANLIAVTAIMLASTQQINCAEMPRSLREAERLYQKGKYSEASDKALEFQKLYPNNLQALIILGMSNFYLNNYKSSKSWFLKANKQSPNHPIITKYLELLRELEYRSGTFSIEPSEKDMNDPQVSADFYKRGYFGHAFPVTSVKDEPGASVPLMEPVLIKEPISSAAIRLPSDLALPTPYPSVESLFSSESYMEQMAREAMEEGKYQKSYLFYSQLAASEPKNRSYLISKAEAAFKMKRYSTVLDILLPISSKASLDTLSEIQRNKVKKLLEESANKKFVPGK
ncbi:MAG: hypothetical protein II961_10025 [Candidatus Riflebacteria bacterium]|nr:hypothetical protein [Candidatus Riflebacteria bacterium]